MHVKPKRTGMLCSLLRLAHNGAAHWPDVLPEHLHLGYLPIFGCIGCVQHHVGNVAVGERLFAFVTGRFRPSTSEWVNISLISFNFSVFRLLIMRLWPDVANLRAQSCPILLVAPVVKAIFLTVIVRFEWGSKKN